MTSAPKPNVAVSLFTIHKVITRGIDVSLENVRGFSTAGIPNEGAFEGYTNYLRALTSILHSHHLVEDDLAFPYFKDKLPETPFEILVAQHQEMVPMLDSINSIIETLESGKQDVEVLEELISILEALKDTWHKHIPIEEEHFDVGVIGSMLPAEEQLSLIKQYAEYSQEHSGPAYLTVPFILYNLPPEIREIMAKGMPAEVTEKLVPIVWKEQWQSMGPYLLE